MSPYFKTQTEAEKALQGYLKEKPAMGVFCKIKFFKISCIDECPYYKKCSFFNYKNPYKSPDSSNMIVRLFPQNHLKTIKMVLVFSHINGFFKWKVKYLDRCTSFNHRDGCQDDEHLNTTKGES